MNNLMQKKRLLVFVGARGSAANAVGFEFLPGRCPSAISGKLPHEVCSFHITDFVKLHVSKLMCSFISPLLVQNCEISKDGFSVLSHLYDVDFPFWLETQRYLCDGCGATKHFTVLNKHLYPEGHSLHANIPLVKFGKVIVVGALDLRCSCC